MSVTCLILLEYKLQMQIYDYNYNHDNNPYYFVYFFFQAEDGIRDAQESRGLGPVLDQLTEISDLCVTGAFAGRVYLNKQTVPVVPATTLSLYANNPRR